MYILYTIFYVHTVYFIYSDVHVCMLNCVQLFAPPWTVACQDLLSMEFSRQEYWSRLPLPSPGDLPDPGIEPTSLVSPALTSKFFPAEPLG